MIGKGYKRLIRRVSIITLSIGILAVSVAYSYGERRGLVIGKYPHDFYSVPRLLPDEPMERNPRFIIYGDSRLGWRLHEKFLKKRNWLTWKMLIFPFYEVYWLGNGAVGGINYWRYNPDYGIREHRMVRDAVYEEGKRSKVDFIFHVGDMPTDGRIPSHWADFLKVNKIERPLVSDFPFLPAIGNHEQANDKTYGRPNYEAIFDYPPFYVLDFPDAAIFVVDSNVILDQYQFIDDDRQDALFQEWFVSGENSEQTAWLERGLASRSQRFKIVVIHHPPVSFAEHHADWVKPEWGRGLQNKRQQLLGLFREYGVQLVFSSHEHLYEHSIVRYSPDSEHAEHVIHVVVTGGGGVPLRSGSDDQKVKQFIQNYRAEGLDVVLLKQEEIYHYCLVDIVPDKIAIQILEVTGDTEKPLRLAEKVEIPK